MQHDAHYKRLFGHPRITGDLLALLQAGLGERFPILKRIQRDTLQRLSGEFIADDLRRRLADLVWKVRLSEPATTERLAEPGPRDSQDGQSWPTGARGQPIDAARSGKDQEDSGIPGGEGDRDVHSAHGDRWLYLVVLLEFQSTVDWMMAVRVQDYAAQLWLDMHRREPFGRNRVPPPILPVVVYNGESRWNAPTRVVDFWRQEPISAVRPGGGIETGPLRFFGDGFVLVDLQALEGGDLPDDNSVSWLARVESVDDEKSLFATLDGILGWLDDAADGTLGAAILEWMRALNDASGFVKAEEFEMAVQTAEGRQRRKGHWTERVRQDRLRRMAQAKAQGRAEGEAVGLERERTLLSRLASRRFGADAARRLAPLLEHADHDGLIEIGDWIADCGDAAELLKCCPSAEN